MAEKLPGRSAILQHEIERLEAEEEAIALSLGIDPTPSQRLVELRWDL
jgi:hypothetical protein